MLYWHQIFLIIIIIVIFANLDNIKARGMFLIFYSSLMIFWKKFHRVELDSI